MKKTYDFDSIYFGALVYYTGKEGYYHCSPVALEKTEDGLYKKLGKDTPMKPYQEGTTDFLTVTKLVPLSTLTDNKGSKEISENKIKLYLFKYCLNSKNKDVTLFAEAKANYEAMYGTKKNK
jgi:hypothetical protein